MTGDTARKHFLAEGNSCADLQLFYEGQEEITLQAALIQGIRPPVGGADQHQPILPEAGEQSVQNGGIGHVIDEELIKAQHLGLASHSVCDLYQGVLAAVVLLQAGVHVQHEVVEVGTLQLQGGISAASVVRHSWRIRKIERDKCSFLNRTEGLLSWIKRLGVMPYACEPEVCQVCTVRQIQPQQDRQTDRQADRKTGRQTDRDRDREVAQPSIVSLIKE